MNRPFLPSDIDPMRNFRRALTARAIAGITGRDVDQVADRLYSKDVADVIKAATTITSTANASGLVSVKIGPFLRSLRPRSAAAQLIERATRVDLKGVGSVSFPRLSTAFPNAAWVAEGGPAPVFQGTMAAVTLTPKKVMALSALTNELAEASAESAEAIISDGLQDSAARALDAKMFSTDAASATAPAGIFNGISATAGTTGGGQAALAGDIAALSGAVLTAGGGSNLAIIASPPQALTLQILGGRLETPVLAAPSLAAGTVAVIDLGAFVSGFGADPEIDVAKNALVHLEDTTPLAIGTVGSPNTVAAPVRDAFQADLTVVRCILRAAWAMRAPAVAYTTTATW